MRALLCKAYGPPSSLKVEEVETPIPGVGEIAIEVEACGVNFPDTLTILGQDQYHPPLPFSPGGEYAGTVVALGQGVEEFAVGDRVLTGTVWGGMREVAVAPVRNSYKIPANMDFLTASVFLCAYGTAYHCLVDRARLQPGETMAVLGASGGVGSALIQVGKILGARVIACASTDEKLAYCTGLGADDVVNYTKEDLKTRLKELTGGGGVDVCCDPVGSDYSEAGLRATGWGGRFMVLGFTAGSIPKIPTNLPLLKGNSIMGVFWSTSTRKQPEQNRANTQRLLEFYQQGKLKPSVYKTYPLEDAPKALQDVLERKVQGKISILIGRTQPK
jgi:NADPH:quinone reductase